MEIRKVIVSGASGFVGKNIVKKMLDHKIEVIALVRDYNKYKDDDILRNTIMIESNINTIEQLQKQIKKIGDIDLFYHLEWRGIKGEQLYDKDIQISNLKYMLNYMQIAKELGCKKFIGAGSIMQLELYYMNGRINDKVKYYRIVKDMCQKIGNEYAQEIGIQFIWPIITNIYGVGEVSSRFINSLLRCLNKNEDFDTTDGRQNYDFVYIDDAINAFYLIGKYGVENRNYVIGSGDVKSLKKWIINIPEIINSKGNIKFGVLEYHNSYLPEKCFDIQDLNKDTGYYSKVKFEEGIRKTSQWMKDYDKVIFGE